MSRPNTWTTEKHTIAIPTDWRINGVWDVNTPRPRESRSGWGKAYKFEKATKVTIEKDTMDFE